MDRTIDRAYFEVNFNPKTFRRLIFRRRETIEIIIRTWRNKGIEIGNSLSIIEKEYNCGEHRDGIAVVRSAP